MTETARDYAFLPAGHSVGWADAFCNGIRSFYKSIQDGTYRDEKQEYATFADAAYIMKIVESCIQSNRENRWLPIK